MSKDLADGGSVVLRALSSQFAFWALAGLAGLFVADAALRGRVDVALRTAGVALFVVWCAWVFLIRMSVHMDASALTARNLLRWIRVPWARVAEVERRAQLTVLVDDGTSVSCWGSPFAPRGGAGRPRGTGRAPAGTITAMNNPYGPPVGSLAGMRGGPAADGALEAVRAVWLSGRHTEGPVTRGWDVPALTAGGVCLVVAILALLV